MNVRRYLLTYRSFDYKHKPNVGRKKIQQKRKKNIKYMFQDKYKLIRDNYCINLIKYHFGTMVQRLCCIVYS